jgi:ElaB/YqjD/DUF883 family membrane-anchored ribosome-binding protein
LHLWDNPMDKLPDQPPSIPDVARAAASDVVDAVNDNMAAAIRRNPLQAVAIAVAVGFVLALIVR